MKQRTANILLFLGACVVSLGLSELAVRLLMKDDLPLFPRYHTDYQYGPYTLRGLRPNSEFWHTSPDGHWRFVTNSRGLRDMREFAYDKPKETLRVLVLGDSHTQGYEVDQDATYSAVLERYLVQHGKHAEALNTGVSGFGTAEELAYLENEGIKYQPDVVVLGFFENDFEDNFKSGLFSLDESGNLIASKFKHVPGVGIQNFIYALPGVRWLSEHSYFYSLLFNTVWNVGKLILIHSANVAAAAPEQQKDASKDASFEYAVTTSASVTPAQRVLASALVGRRKKLRKKNHVRLIVVDIPGYPSPYHIRPSLPADMRDDLARAGVELLDVKSILAPYDGAAMLHVPHGYNHISALAHALLGVGVGHAIEVGASQ